MFEQIKDKVSLLEVLEKDLGVTFRRSGEKNWEIDGDKDLESCPFCGHHGCFKVLYEPGAEQDAMYKCFSCEEKGDVISWRAKREELSQVDAAKALAKEFNLDISFTPASTTQQIFNAAAGYYHNCLVDSADIANPALDGKTPLEYQAQVRKHSKELLTKLKIGFSNGTLTEFLLSVGFTTQDVEASGLARKSKSGNGKLKDFLPSNTFIYPHFHRGNACHFTFKDPKKEKEFQLPKKYTLGGCLFYGQDTFDRSDTLILVEGENDLASVVATGRSASTMALIGQISSDQLDWLRKNAKNKSIITIFDPDSAGDKYRVKLEMLRPSFKNLAHIRPSEDKDIDEHLREGADLLDLLRSCKVEVKIPANARVVALDFDSAVGAKEPTAMPDYAPQFATPPSIADTVEVLPAAAKYQPPDLSSSPGTIAESEAQDRGEGVVASVDDDDLMVFEFKGCYYRRRYKDGIPQDTRISDFTIALKNVYVYEDGDRKREAVLRRVDGKSSGPILVDSETKVSLKAFKVMAAKAVDGEWTGRELELDQVWRLVYSKFPDATIQVPRQVGRHNLLKGWLFKNMYITSSGRTVLPDEDGVFWIQGKSLGVKPQRLDEEDADLGSLPILDNSMNREEADALLGEALKHLAANLGSMGKALIALGWIKSNIYSDEIFRANRGMSLLMLWGRNGGGKTTVVSWLRYLLGMYENTGRSSINQLRSGVGFLRQGEFYGSMPMFLDELRDDEKTQSYMGMIRSWYDREGRTLASKESFGVRYQRIRSNLALAGEDLPTDPATRERLVTIRVPKEGRDTVHSYAWFQSNATSLSNIGYWWIKDSCEVSMPDMMEEISQIDKRIRAAGCSARLSKNWAATGYFGEQLCQRYCPDFDFLAYLVSETKEEHDKQVDDSTVNGFIEQIDVMMSQDNPKITYNHVRADIDAGRVYIWYSAVFAIIKDSCRGASWSRNAILRSMREEPWFISDSQKVAMGIDGVRRTVVSIDLNLAPDSIKSLAKCLE